MNYKKYVKTCVVCNKPTSWFSRFVGKCGNCGHASSDFWVRREKK